MCGHGVCKTLDIRWLWFNDTSRRMNEAAILPAALRASEFQSGVRTQRATWKLRTHVALACRTEQKRTAAELGWGLSNTCDRHPGLLCNSQDMGGGTKGLVGWNIACLCWKLSLLKPVLQQRDGSMAFPLGTHPTDLKRSKELQKYLKVLKNIQPGVVTHSLNTNILKAEVGMSVS